VLVGEKVPPEQVGLVKAECPTTMECAWVCDGDCKAKYEAEGSRGCAVRISTQHL
jgi:hypothetical protein